MIINGTDRHVAYCRRVDTAPSIYLEDGVSWFLLGATTYSLPKVSCSDSEDAGNMGDPTDNINSVVDVNTAGNYIEPSLNSINVLCLGFSGTQLCRGCLHTLLPAGNIHVHGQRWAVNNWNTDSHSKGKLLGAYSRESELHHRLLCGRDDVCSWHHVHVLDSVF